MTQVVRNLEILHNGSFAMGVSPSDWVDARALATSTAEAHTVPTGAKYVLFSANCDFYVRYNATVSGTAAAVPGDTTDGTACELNPTMRYLNGVAEISLITAAGSGGIVTMVFKR